VKYQNIKAILWPAVLYCCVIWSPEFREQERRKHFENRVLRAITGPNGKEVNRALERNSQ